MAITALVALVALQYNPSGPRIQVTLEGGKSFVIATDPKNYPKTVAGITKLVKNGFYNGQRFHRVEPWVVQWGDPGSKKSIDQPGIGSGGSGTSLPFEGGVAPFKRGTVGIASTGGGVGGDSQLFVVTKDADWLYNQYAALGKVVSGMNVVDNIKRGDKIVRMVVLGKKGK